MECTQIDYKRFELSNTYNNLKYLLRRFAMKFVKKNYENETLEDSNYFATVKPLSEMKRQEPESVTSDDYELIGLFITGRFEI